MMIRKKSILFLDIGNVVLSNGWDHKSREEACKHFQLDLQVINSRHALIFDTYEIGKITLENYIEQVVFYEARNFTVNDFKAFMFEQSRPLQPMLDFMKGWKHRTGIKIIAVSNEGRELMLNRINKFNLKELYDSFICSGFVGLRKPDLDIFRLALNTAQVDPKDVLFVDDRAMLSEIVSRIGIVGIQHVSYEKTKEQLEKYF